MACSTPYHVRDKSNGQLVPVPCGKCPPCVKRRISGWSFRLRTEDRQATSAAFITLTYDSKFVPITRNGFMCLDKRHVQLFFKRLRKAHPADYSPNPIKYFAVGEYGGKTRRPHYHIIVFNADIERIDKAWQLGTTHFGTVSGASVGYCLKYMSKPSKFPLHRNDDRIPEFSLMSKDLGLTTSRRLLGVGIPETLQIVRILRLKTAKKSLSLGTTKTNSTLKRNVRLSHSSVNKRLKPITSRNLLNTVPPKNLTLTVLQSMLRNSLVTKSIRRKDVTKSSSTLTPRRRLPFI